MDHDAASQPLHERRESASEDESWCPLLMWRMPATEGEWAQLRAMSHLDDDSADESGHDDGEPRTRAAADAVVRSSAGAKAALPAGAFAAPVRASVGAEAGTSAARTRRSQQSAGQASVAAGAVGRYARQQAQLLATARERQQRRRLKQRRAQSARRPLLPGAGVGGSAAPPEGDLADDVDALAVCLESFASVAALA